MPTWIPMFALPNVDVEEPIETDGMALVSVRDERIRELANQHKNFAAYIDKFESEFGGKILPSIVICREDSAPLFDLSRQ